MIPINLKEDIIYKMTQKRFSKKDQKYILRYLELNSDIFNYIETEKIVERIIENFSGISFNFAKFIFGGYGEYEPTRGKIYLSPKLLTFKERKYKESVILHELDHCACTPIELKEKYFKYIKQLKEKYSYFYKIIPDFILKEIFYKIYYDGPITGVFTISINNENKIKKLIYGINWKNYLNEGITSFKQLKYSEISNVKFHYKKDFYRSARRGVECIGNVIGVEELILLHFNNNFNKIEKNFYEKTQITIEELLINCMKCDRINSKNSRKKLEKIIKIIETK